MRKIRIDRTHELRRSGADWLLYELVGGTWVMRAARFVTVRAAVRYVRA